MAGLRKDEIGTRSIAALAGAVAAVEPAFPSRAFAADAGAGLGRLELKARIEHVADALERHLPGPFARDAGIVSTAVDRAQLGTWAAWPAITWVERFGLDDPEPALDAIARLTRYASGEAAIRPFLLRHPRLTWARLEEWVASDDLHLRRLVSEGTRPRLPWATRLRDLQGDPTPSLRLLDRLTDDPELYVRRSVANHLNDIAKDHPALAVATARSWLEAGGQHAEWIAHHGLRTLVKAGDAEALRALGIDGDVPVAVEGFTLEPGRVELGGAVRFRFALRLEAAAPARVVVDYVVDHRKANGGTTPKVFKLSTFTLEPGAETVVERTHRIRPITTRRYHGGEHRLSIQVNGRIRAGAPFELAVPE